jgi:UrcA family protein
MFRIVSKLVVPVVLSLSPLCHADTTPEPGYEVLTRTVKFADLDLGGKEGAAALYNRIRSAATEVCVTPVASGTIDLFARQLHCQREAIGQAVREVNSPKLTQLHMSRTNRVHLAMAGE